MSAAPLPTDWDAFSRYWTEILAAQAIAQGASQGTSVPWPLPQQIHILPQVDSTNQTLWQLLAQGHPVGTTVIAQAQTAGRGQWGRRWTSATGGLYLSWSCAPNLPAERVAQLTLCSAWGIATALRQWGVPVALKWPNDLVLQRRKLGGILTETRLRGDTIQQAVVGVGINWANPVPEVGINLQTFWAEQAWVEQIAFAQENPTGTGSQAVREAWGGYPADPLPRPPVNATPVETPRPQVDPPLWGPTKMAIPREEMHAPKINSLAHLAAIVLHGIVTGYRYWQHEGITKLLPAYEALLSQPYQTVQFQGQSLTILGITPMGGLRVQGAGDGKEAAEHILQPGEVRLGYDRFGYARLGYYVNESYP
ncbi:biotin--[acetyl-CoA-carboxylase] ligase [Trichothermofontia sp.]